MERLTPSTYSSLAEAYSAVYNEDLRSELNEEQQIQEFLGFVDTLLEEGYDLSEYTYDELYESYLDEGWRDAVVKGLVKYGGKALQAGKGLVKAGWKGTTKIDPKTGTSKFVPGAEQSAKELAAKVGKLSVPTAAALGVAQWATGKVPEYVGGGINALRTAGHNLPSPGESGQAIQDVGKGLQPHIQDPRQKRKKDPWASAPDSLLKQSTDLFDLIKGHLLDEGYADTNEAALVIMANMSEEWRESIVESIARGSAPNSPTGTIGGAAGRVAGTLLQKGAELIKNNMPQSGGGYSTRPGDGKPYKDGPLWGPGSSDSPVRKPTPQRKPQGAPMRDEPLW